MESIERNGAAGAAVAPLRVVAAAADGTKVRPPASFERKCMGDMGELWTVTLQSLGQRLLLALNQVVRCARHARPRPFVRSFVRSYDH